MVLLLFELVAVLGWWKAYWQLDTVVMVVKKGEGGES